MDSTTALAVERRRRFSKRAREHVLAACSALDDNDEIASSEGVDDDEKPHMTAHLIEKTAKQCKSHRSASDFDAGVINETVEKVRKQQRGNDKQSSQIEQQTG